MKNKRHIHCFFVLLLGIFCSFSDLYAVSKSKNRMGALKKKKEQSYSHVDSKGVPLDYKLIQRINPTNKVFIEAGANNGLRQSNTKLLESKHGWTGILVEPSAALYPELCANRPHSKCFQCALGSFEENNSYLYGDFDGDLMSSIDGLRRNNKAENKVLVRSLQSILEEVEVQHVNFFSLDTEGYELNILKGIDFNKTTFDYILVETYPHNHHEIVSLLASKGYTLEECLSEYNPVTNPQWDGLHNDYFFKKRVQ